MNAASHDTKIRFVGQCPVCGGDFKLLKDKLVHHGYRRPGYGQIVGDCFAVHYEPYERSTLACEDYKAAMVRTRQLLVTRLPTLKDGSVRTLAVYLYKGFGRSELTRVSADSEDPRERASFAKHLEQEIRRVEEEIKFCGFELERMDRLIKDWVKKPVRTVEEFVSVIEQKVAARRAEREAAQAHRRAKTAEKQAKAERREAERLALIVEYKSKFQELGAQTRHAASRAHAVGLWREMHKRMNKAYLHFAAHTLECDTLLVEFGLARVSGHGGTNRTYYADRSGYLWTPT